MFDINCRQNSNNILHTTYQLKGLEERNTNLVLVSINNLNFRDKLINYRQMLVFILSIISIVCNALYRYTKYSVLIYL